MRGILPGGTIVRLDDVTAWLLDMCKSHGFDSITDKHLLASFRIVLQDVTRSLACTARMVDSKRTQAEGTC